MEIQTDIVKKHKAVNLINRFVLRIFLPFI